jgi:HKD family nuclease
MSGMLGGGWATVIDLPRGFSWPKEAKRAGRIRLATAFAHYSGWGLLKPAITASSARVSLIAGVDFLQTEPRVLRDWLDLATIGRIDAHVVLSGKQGIFHPKVLAVETPEHSWAIVGSGNLSLGGLQNNVECSLFEQRPHVVGLVERWFDHLLSEEARTEITVAPLTEAWLQQYRRRYEAAARIQREARRRLKAESRGLASATRDLETTGRKLVNLVNRRVSRSDFPPRLADWEPAKRILHVLRAPKLNFSREDWHDFCGIHALGKLDPRTAFGCWDDIRRFKAGLRQLLDGSIAVDRRFDQLVAPKGRFKVRGVGRNVVSKILTAAEPKRWPAWNGMLDAVLAYYGYNHPRGSPGRKYAALASAMQAVVRRSKARDMYDLDCVLYDEARRLLS